MKLTVMNDWKKKAVLGFAGAVTLGAFGLAAATNASADTVKTVQSGDSLWSISQKTGHSVDSLKNVNHLTSDTIHVGQRLTIGGSTVTVPTAASTSAKAITDTVKIVQKGDTLWGISQATGQSVDNIKNVNHLTSDVIYVGQRLTISGSTAKTPATTVQTQQTQAPTQISKTQAPVQTQQRQAPTQSVKTPAPVQTQQTQAPTQRQQTQAPVQKTSTPVQKQQTTVASTQSTKTQVAAPAANNSSSKSWIAQRESGGSYTARNGQYYGKYQLSSSYLHGDYSPANQERVADSYVNSRYGSWDNAKQHWMVNGWY